MTFKAQTRSGKHLGTWDLSAYGSPRSGEVVVCEDGTFRILFKRNKMLIVEEILHSC